jgi:PST family polysaccharide transporter
VQGLIWLAGARVFGQLVSFLVTAILARLLSPGDYGLIGMVTVVTGFLSLFADFGTGMAVIQQKDLREEQLSSVFWFNVALGSLLCLVLVAISHGAARFYGEPALVSLMCVMGIGFPLTSLGIVQQSLFRRRLEFSVPVKANVTATLAAGLVGIATALLGWGVWALVAQSLSQAFVATALLWSLSAWRPQFHFHSADIRGIAGFSGNLAGFNIVNYFARNFDCLLIGRVLGVGPLGLYALAYRLMLYPISNLSGIAGEAFFPAFSQMQSESDRLSSAYLRTCRYIALVTFPLMAGISLMSREIILVLFGRRWEGAAVTLQILALVGMFQPLISLYGTVILARGFARWFFRWGAVVSTVMVASFVIGLRWGIVGVAACYLVSQTITSVIGLPVLFRKGGTSVFEFLSVLWIPAVGTSFMSVGVLTARYGLTYRTEMPHVLTLAICALVGIICYGVVIWSKRHSFCRMAYLDMQSLLFRRA